jgi:hypothetical protein
MTDRPEPTAGERPVFVVHLRPAAGVDGKRALRALLKIALRRLGLKYLGIHEKRRS